MSFDPKSSDLRLIWHSFIEFESYSRETDGDLNYFIEEWKEKMDKVMSAGIQIPDLLLGLKLIEKANLSQEFIESVIAQLSSFNSSSGSFLAQVVTNIKESRDINGFHIGNGKERAKNPSTKVVDQEELLSALESNSNSVSCSKRSMNFVDAENLSKHHHQLHSDVKEELEHQCKSVPGLTKCLYCDKSFTIKKNLEVHMKSHYNDVNSVTGTLVKELSCLPGSNTKLSNEYYLDDEEIKIEIMSDVDLHSDVKDCLAEISLDTNLNTLPCRAFNCNICQKEFTRALDLKHHIEIHTTAKIKCSICELTFNTKCGINEHMKRMHGQNGTEGDAEVTKNLLTERLFCDGSLEKSDNPEKEEFDKEEISLELEVDNNLVSCSKCSEKFLDHESLSEHYCTFPPEVKREDMVIHSEKESKYKQGLLKCPYCDKHFTLLETLEVHLKSHGNSVSFKSETVADEWNNSCEKPVTITREVIEDQERSQTAIKSKCEICSRLISNANIARHMETHTRDPFKCSICQKEFQRAKPLRRHMEYHNSGRVECSLCHKQLKTKYELRIHVKRMHEQEDIRPKERVGVSKSSLSLMTSSCIISNANVKRVHDNEDIVAKEDPEDKKSGHTVSKSLCEICSKVISNANMAKHMETHTRDPFKCSICQKEFQQVTPLRRHMETHTTTRIKCSLCEKTFKTYYVLRSHVKRVHDKKDTTNGEDNENKKNCFTVMKFNCKICSRLISNANMPKHMETHTRDPFKCGICQKEFQQAKPLRRHMEYHNPARLKCPLCDKIFKTKYQVRSHVKRKHEKKDIIIGEESKENVISTIKKNVRYPCEVCGKLVDVGRLGVHMKTHGHETFECSFCQKKFKTKWYLKAHMPTHNATNEYVCAICGKKYKTKMSLYEHKMSQHSSKRPLPCKFCKKVFFSYGLRTFHIRAHHTGEKPYKCDFCDKRFYISSRKTQHMRYHTGEKPFQCHICGKYFKEGTSRKRHIRNVHKEIQPDDV